jgi:hypothetical protein
MGPLFMRLPFARALSVATLAMLPASVACSGATPAAKTPAVGPSGGSALGATGPLAAAAPSEEGAIVPISATDPVWGSRRALVSIVVFGDFQCPYTAMILKTVQALEQKYGPTDLRVVWKDLPLAFHVQARPAGATPSGNTGSRPSRIKRISPPHRSRAGPRGRGSTSRATDGSWRRTRAPRESTQGALWPNGSV